MRQKAFALIMVSVVLAMLCLTTNGALANASMGLYEDMLPVDLYNSTIHSSRRAGCRSSRAQEA